MSLQASIAAAIAATLTGTAIGGSQAAYTKNKFADITLTDGSGSGQANKLWDAVRSVASGANDDIDLNGALTDPFGVAVNFSTVKAIIIRADGANTTNLTVGNGTNPFVGPFGAAAHTLQLKPGGVIVLVAPQTGWTVTAATADILRIANAAGATASYSITILGT